MTASVTTATESVSWHTEVVEPSRATLLLDAASLTRNVSYASPPAAEPFAPPQPIGGFSYQGKFWVGGDELRLPVRVELQGRAGQFTTTNPETGIFGSGSTPAEAVIDFRAALHEHLEVLERQEALSAELEEQRNFLRRHLRQS